MLYRSVVKPFLDRLLSFLALAVLWPILLLLALLIKCDSRGPVLFRQKRVGKGKSFFTILKFRTMRADTPKDVPTHLLENPEAQITRMGRFLRRTSLDELPQILNILAGQMSIIGPRPALWNQDDLVAERDKYDANSLVPGLTGYAQINGRDELPIGVKAELDGYYAQNISFALDVRIFFGTIRSVFRGSGVVEGRHSAQPGDKPSSVTEDEEKNHP
ncbi:sugar transferase [Ruminococcaceae bacterium OttesenSCG-928-A11]|nr:sugar transferase [Ruminococcaceae bacterium OttesenSCG-928-A11]